MRTVEPDRGFVLRYTGFKGPGSLQSWAPLLLALRLPRSGREEKSFLGKPGLILQSVKMGVFTTLH